MKQNIVIIPCNVDIYSITLHWLFRLNMLLVEKKYVCNIYINMKMFKLFVWNLIQLDLF